MTRQKRGRSVSSKDKSPRERKIVNGQNDLVENINTHEEIHDIISEEDEIPKDENEISINYVATEKIELN